MRTKAGPNILFLTSLLLATPCCFTACKDDRPQTIKEEPISFAKEGELSIFRSEADASLVDLDIEIASSDYEIQTGLMYRKEMGDRQGMLFIFQEEAPHSFYMKNTLIALDILFIDKDLVIKKIHRNAEPLNESGIPSGGPVQYVLEVKAGMADRWGLREGDLIKYQKAP